MCVDLKLTDVENRFHNYVDFQSTEGITAYHEHGIETGLSLNPIFFPQLFRYR